MDPLIPHARHLGKKMQVMQASLRKLEDASYTLALRSKEYEAYPAEIKAALLEQSLAEMASEQERDHAEGGS